MLGVFSTGFNRRYGDAHLPGSTRLFVLLILGLLKVKYPGRRGEEKQLFYAQTNMMEQRVGWGRQSYI